MPPPSARSSHLPPAFSRRATLVFSCLPLQSLLPNLGSPCPLPHSPLLLSYLPLCTAHAALAQPLRLLLLHKFRLRFPPNLRRSRPPCLLLPLLLSLLACPTCSLLCVLNGSELCSGWVLPAFALCTCASLVRPAADHGSRAGFRATAAVLLGFASSMVSHPVLGALFLPSLFAVAAHVLHAVSPAICLSDCLWGGTSTANDR